MLSCMSLYAEKYPGHAERKEETKKLFFEKSEVEVNLKLGRTCRRDQSEHDENKLLDAPGRPGQTAELARGREIIAHVLKIAQFQTFQSFKTFQPSPEQNAGKPIGLFHRFVSLWV